MDAATLQARLNVARSFEHAIGHITFRCRLIPELLVAGIYSRHNGSHVDAARDLLAATVLGVRGATTEDLYLDGKEAIEDSKDAAIMLLDDRQDLAIELAAEIAFRVAGRNKSIEADTKNSLSGSATT